MSNQKGNNQNNSGQPYVSFPRAKTGHQTDDSARVKPGYTYGFTSQRSQVPQIQPPPPRIQQRLVENSQNLLPAKSQISLFVDFVRKT